MSWKNSERQFHSSSTLHMYWPVCSGVWRGQLQQTDPLFFCWLDLVAAILNLNFISATQKKTVNEGLRGLWVKLAAGFHHCYYYYYVTAHSCSLNTAHRFRYVSIRTVRLTALYRCVSSTWQMLNWPHQTGGVKKRRKGNEGKIRWKLTKKQAERF